MIWLQELKMIIQKQFLYDRQKKFLIKWKQSLLAIIFALLLTAILILIKGDNPFLVFIDIIKGATRNQASWEQTGIYFAMFTLAGLAIIVGFKTGLFNIGVGGQMLISGITMMILAVQVALPWIVLVIIGMLVAALAASISGFLKALFNIHEVVSTILINWIFFWISQYLLNPDMPWVDGFGTTKAISDSSRLMINHSIVLPSLIVTFVLLIGAIILFNFTKFGYALKATGQNPDAAKYAGIKVAWQLALGMALSGLIVGALASVNYLGKFGSMASSVGKELPAIGFQGISVALIAFNNLLGLIPAAFFWSMITSGTDFATIIHPEIPREILQLMNGLMIYTIAISLIFIRFRPCKIIYHFYLKMHSPEIKAKRVKVKKARVNQKQLFANKIAQIRQKDNPHLTQEILELKNEQKKLRLKIAQTRRNYYRKNKKPAFWHFSTSQGKLIKNHYHLINQNYQKEKQIYNLNCYHQVQKLLVDLARNQKKLQHCQAKLPKQLIAKNKKECQIGMAIIKEQYLKKTADSITKASQETWIGKIKNYWHQSKIKNQKFNEQLTLLLLNYHQDRKILKSKIEKQKLKQQFKAKIAQLYKSKKGA